MKLVMKERQDSTPVNPVEEAAAGTWDCTACDGIGRVYGEPCAVCGGPGVLKKCTGAGCNGGFIVAGKDTWGNPTHKRCPVCKGAGGERMEDDIYEGETRDMAKDKLKRRNATTDRDREKGQEYKALNKDLSASKGDPKAIERTRMKMNAKFPAHKVSNRRRADNVRE
jgi:hypothetical protein